MFVTAAETRTGAGDCGASRTTTDGVRPRRLRADARRNREKLLAAAEEIFAVHGTRASTEQIARHAGVGVGTVFRHFPTKERLLEAVYLSHLRRLDDEARSLSAADDPGEAFFVFFHRVIEQAAAKAAYAAALAEAGVDVEQTSSQVRDDLRQSLSRLIERAQEAGALRDDIGVREVLALLVGTTRAAEQAGADLTARARTLSVIVDGLKP